MKTLKQQISAVKTAIDVRKALYNTSLFFALSKPVQKRIEKLFDTGGRRKCKSDSLRDAATTLIALNLLTENRKNFINTFVKF